MRYLLETRSKIRTLLGVFGISLLLSACSGDPLLDTSDDESYTATARRIVRRLPEEERKPFLSALTTIKMADNIQWDLPVSYRERANGKTGREIIEFAKEVKREQKQAEDLKKMAHLAQRKQAAEKNLVGLSQFQVLKSRFFMRAHPTQGAQPVIELKVKNDTSSAISKVYFAGVLRSEGRETPWYDDTFNYQIPGGIEPGEETTWSLSPRILSELHGLSADEKLSFDVTIQQLDDAKGKTLYSLRMFSKEDEERLAELEAEYGEAPEGVEDTDDPSED